MSGIRRSGPGSQGHALGTPTHARLNEREAREAAEIEAKLAELRALFERGVISSEDLALLEAQGKSKLIELRESSARTGATMGEYVWTLTESQRRRVVNGESLDAVLAEGTGAKDEVLSAADIAVSLFESFRHQYDDVTAFHMARGRDLSEAAMEHALRARNITPPAGDGAPVDTSTADIARSFQELGLSESAAHIATEGR